ncbi:MAG TPA: lytic murein transglycosylase [Rhizomicrobium sp.]|jgi:membrane-bound lytic murein transglycosylase B|nr:lytic murein transglycosylase [Rhizomicrobium sp.]
MSMQAKIRAVWLALAVLVIGGLPAKTSFAQTALPTLSADADAQFQAFLAGFRTTAIQAGIDPPIWDASMSALAPDPRVEELDLQQPEFVKPVWDYLDSTVSPERVAAGQERLAAYADILNAIELRFGVQKEILVAIWGIESNYGAEMGSFDIFDALATLAYQGPRSDFGRRELLDALRIEQQERIVPAEMTSSWAGAFGQTQFVPSAFLRYAVDGDGDGKRDLWHSPADALASAANLLAQSGWERGAPWGYQVILPTNFPYELADLDKPGTITSWRNLGVRAAGGWALPVSEARAAIYLPAGARGPAFMVFDNFRTVLKYNNAASYALAVCTLADRLEGRPPIVVDWPRDALPLSRPEQLALQTDLQRLGYDPGALDGILGRQGRAALRAWQKSRGLVPDGYATESLLEQIEREMAAPGMNTTTTGSK